MGSQSTWRRLRRPRGSGAGVDLPPVTVGFHLRSRLVARDHRASSRRPRVFHARSRPPLRIPPTELSAPLVASEFEVLDGSQPVAVDRPCVDDADVAVPGFDGDREGHCANRRDPPVAVVEGPPPRLVDGPRFAPSGMRPPRSRGSPWLPHRSARPRATRSHRSSAVRGRRGPRPRTGGPGRAGSSPPRAGPPTSGSTPWTSPTTKSRPVWFDSIRRVGLVIVCPFNLGSEDPSSSHGRRGAPLAFRNPSPAQSAAPWCSRSSSRA